MQLQEREEKEAELKQEEERGWSFFRFSITKA